MDPDEALGSIPHSLEDIQLLVHHPTADGVAPNDCLGFPAGSGGGPQDFGLGGG
jgi:hypothetical protein